MRKKEVHDDDDDDTAMIVGGGARVSEEQGCVVCPLSSRRRTGASGAWARLATSWDPLHCRCCPSSHHNRYNCCSHRKKLHSGFRCSYCFHNKSLLVHRS